MHSVVVLDLEELLPSAMLAVCSSMPDLWHFNFLFVPFGGLSWLPISFLLHVKYTLSYRMFWGPVLCHQFLVVVNILTA